MLVVARNGLIVAERDILTYFTTILDVLREPIDGIPYLPRVFRMQQLAQDLGHFCVSLTHARRRRR